MLGLLDPFHQSDYVSAEGNQTLSLLALRFNIILNVHTSFALQCSRCDLSDIPQWSPNLPLQVISIHVKHLISNYLRILEDAFELRICQVAAHHKETFDSSLATGLILISRHVLDLPVINL